MMVTDGKVPGGAKNEVDDKKIEGGVKTKHWRNSHQHGVSHTWKRRGQNFRMA